MAGNIGNNEVPLLKDSDDDGSFRKPGQQKEATPTSPDVAVDVKPQPAVLDVPAGASIPLVPQGRNASEQLNVANRRSDCNKALWLRRSFICILVFCHLFGLGLFTYDSINENNWRQVIVNGIGVILAALFWPRTWNSEKWWSDTWTELGIISDDDQQLNGYNAPDPLNSNKCYWMLFVVLTFIEFGLRQVLNNYLYFDNIFTPNAIVSPYRKGFFVVFALINGCIASSLILGFASKCFRIPWNVKREIEIETVRHVSNPHAATDFIEKVWEMRMKALRNTARLNDECATIIGWLFLMLVCDVTVELSRYRANADLTQLQFLGIAGAVAVDIFRLCLIVGPSYRVGSAIRSAIDQAVRFQYNLRQRAKQELEDFSTAIQRDPLAITIGPVLVDHTPIAAVVYMILATYFVPIR